MKKEQGQKTAQKEGSRRAKIIKLVQENKWTVQKLAEELVKTNKKWSAEKNSAAITGTLADLKKQGWSVSKKADGVIEVKPK